AGQARKADRQLPDTGFLKSGVVDDDGAALSTRCNQCLGKCFGWVLSGEIEKRLLIKLPRAFQVMHTELEGDLLIGARALPDRHTKLNGLKVHKVGWQFVCG